MKLVTIEYGGRRSAAVVISRGYVALDALNEKKRTDWPTDLSVLVESGDAARLAVWYRAGGKAVLEGANRKLIVPHGEAREIGEAHEIATE